MIAIALTSCKTRGGLCVSLESNTASIQLYGSPICACAKVSEWRKLPDETLGEIESMIDRAHEVIGEAAQ